MTHPLVFALPLALALTGGATAQQPDLPPGLRSAQLLPGWTDGSGMRVLALELILEPGWKTYWRSPGDTGLPPEMAWEGSDNLAGVRLHWPAPQAIRSGDTLEMGYHDRLLLPLTARPANAGLPVSLRAQVDLGLCKDICVPVHLELEAPAPGDRPDPAIVQALAAEPMRLEQSPACTVTQIADGLRVAMALPPDGARLAAIELIDSPQVWVSGARLVSGPAGPQAVAEMVGPTGLPFDLDLGALRLTVIPQDGSRATETIGCTTG